MNNITYEMAELIVERLRSRKKPTAVFITSLGLRFKTPSQVLENDIYKTNYIGTYTNKVEISEILEDCQ